MHFKIVLITVAIATNSCVLDDELVTGLKRLAYFLNLVTTDSFYIVERNKSTKSKVACRPI